MTRFNGGDRWIVLTNPDEPLRAGAYVCSACGTNCLKALIESADRFACPRCGGECARIYNACGAMVNADLIRCERNGCWAGFDNSPVRPMHGGSRHEGNLVKAPRKPWGLRLRTIGRAP